MVGELIPALVDPVKADAAFWKRYHEIRRLWEQEMRPEDPPTPEDIEEGLMKRYDPFRITHRYEVVHDGVMLGWFSGSVVRPGSPEYESNKQFFEAWAYTRPEMRRQRVATSLLPLAVELAGLHGCTIVNFYTEDTPGHEFLKWIGAEPKLTELESRLKLADLDWSMVERWAAEGSARNPQTKLEIYDGHLPESMWDDFARQYTELINMIPWESMEHGDEIVTPEQMREWYARQDMRGTRQHSVVAREPDGLIAGLTDVDWTPYKPALAHQQLTAVRPASRGRGIGKWIKATMLLRLRELYPELKWVATENAGSNAPMLKINRELGFRPFVTGVEYQIARDQLAEKISSL